MFDLCWHRLNLQEYFIYNLSNYYNLYSLTCSSVRNENETAPECKFLRGQQNNFQIIINDKIDLIIYYNNCVLFIMSNTGHRGLVA